MCHPKELGRVMLKEHSLGKNGFRWIALFALKTAFTRCRHILKTVKNVTDKPPVHTKTAHFCRHNFENGSFLAQILLPSHFSPFSKCAGIVRTQSKTSMHVSINISQYFSNFDSSNQPQTTNRQLSYTLKFAPETEYKNRRSSWSIL